MLIQEKKKKIIFPKIKLVFCVVYVENFNETNLSKGIVGFSYLWYIVYEFKWNCELWSLIGYTWVCFVEFCMGTR